MKDKDIAMQIRDRPQRFGIDKIINGEGSPWIISSADPIDFGWEHLRTVTETLENMVSSMGIKGSHNKWRYKPDEIGLFLNRYEAALKAASKLIGFGGDFRDQPYVIWMPGNTRYCESFQYGFIWKDDNNGTTFFATPLSYECYHHREGFYEGFNYRA